MQQAMVEFVRYGQRESKYNNEIVRQNGRASNSQKSIEDRRRGLEREIKRLVQKGELRTNKPFTSPDEAAKSVLNIMTSLSTDYNLEIGGNIE